MKKRKLILIGLLIWNLNSVFGQICGTSHTLKPTIYPQQDKNIQAKGSSSAICINVFFHIVRNTNGTNAFNIPNTNIITERLNEFYSPHNIIINNMGESFINNSNYVNISEGEHKTLMNSGYDVPNAINYYIVEELWDVYRNGVYQGFVTGVADDIPANSLVIRNDRVFESTSPHELGHCLNLYHTFHGSISENVPNSCAENINNNANCNSCGDYVCDTPADQNLGNFNGYSPDLSNIMSYYTGRDSFSNGQGLRIRSAINNESILQNIVSNSCTTISEVNNVCYPQTTTISLNNVGGATTSWSSSSNVQIVSSNNTSTVIRGATSSSTGSGWVKVILSSGITLQEDFWVGKPKAVTELSHVYTFGCTKGEINAISVAGADQYEWRIYGGTIVIPNTGTNTYTGGETIFVDPFDDNYTFTVKVRAKNSCGYSAWYSKNIPTQCDPNAGGETPLFIIYPNPASRNLNIEAVPQNNLDEIDFSKYQINATYRLFDFSSNLVKKGTIKELTSIQIYDLQKGRYVLKINHENQIENHHIIIK